MFNLYGEVSNVKSKVLVGLLFSLSLLLGGCGSSSSSNSKVGAEPQSNVQGVAAVGEAISGADVVAQCHNGKQYFIDGGVKTNAKGEWSGFIDDSDFPCVLQLSNGAPNVELTSIVYQEGIANITPITSVVLAMATKNATLGWLDDANEWPRVEDVLEQTQALLEVLQAKAYISFDFATEEDPFTVSFQANGQGWDKLLDNMRSLADLNSTVTKISYSELINKAAKDELSDLPNNTTEEKDDNKPVEGGEESNGGSDNNGSESPQPPVLPNNSKDAGPVLRQSDCPVSIGNCAPRVFFVVNQAESGTFPAVWATNGTAEGTYVVMDSSTIKDDGKIAETEKKYAVSNNLFYYIDQTKGLIASDGTKGGTVVAFKPEEGFIISIYAASNVLYIAGSNDQLWVLDTDVETEAGKPVFEEPIPADFYTKGISPKNMPEDSLVLNDTLYFSCHYDNRNSRGLCTYSPKGKLASLNHSVSFNATDLMVFAGSSKIIFVCEKEIDKLTYSQICSFDIKTQNFAYLTDHQVSRDTLHIETAADNKIVLYKGNKGMATELYIYDFKEKEQGIKRIESTDNDMIEFANVFAIEERLFFIGSDGFLYIYDAKERKAKSALQLAGYPVIPYHVLDSQLFWLSAGDQYTYVFDLDRIKIKDIDDGAIYRPLKIMGVKEALPQGMLSGEVYFKGMKELVDGTETNYSFNTGCIRLYKTLGNADSRDSSKTDNTVVVDLPTRNPVECDKVTY